ncbi:hypothetical protein TNCV_1982931 [Trichonephila clavipes]|nr:hypothetical protein TNCV_1982931 [Trichonephila clavipes]
MHAKSQLPHWHLCIPESSQGAWLKDIMCATHRRLRLELCHARRGLTVTELNQVIFSDKSRFNLSSDYNRVRVWRPHQSCLRFTAT